MQSRRLLVVLVTVVILEVMSSCGGLTKDQQEINGYIEDSAPVATSSQPSDKAAGDPQASEEAVSGVKYQCTTVPRTLTANPDDIVALNADSGKLWAGALLQGQGYAGGLGSLAELPIRDRAPLTIYTDLGGSHISAKVDSPNGATVQTAINDLIQRAESKHINPPANVTYTSTQAYSAEQGLLSLGLSVKYAGVQASADLGISNSATQSSLLVSITERLFTIKIVKPATPVEYFSNDFTYSDLMAQHDAGRISPTNPPVVVSQIVYGLRLIYSVTADTSIDKLQAAVAASYDGGAASAKVHLTDEQSNILSSATYNVVAVGGDVTATKNLIRDHAIGDYMSARTSLSSAVPISYQVDNVINDTAAAFTETTNYNLKTCTVKPPNPILVGAVVRIDSVHGVNHCDNNSPWLFGQLFINGTSIWNANDSKSDWNIPSGLGEFTFKQQVTLPTGPPPDSRYQVGALTPGEYALINDPSNPDASGPGLQMTGSIKEHETFGGLPTNIYNRSYSYPVANYGLQTITGGSAHCDIDLMFNLTKVQDIYVEGP